MYRCNMTGSSLWSWILFEEEKYFQLISNSLSYFRISMETASLGGLAGFQYISPNHIIKSPVHWQNGKNRTSQMGKTVHWNAKFIQLLPWNQREKQVLNWKKEKTKKTKLVLAVALPVSVWRDQSGLWIWRMSLINW